MFIFAFIAGILAVPLYAFLITAALVGTWVFTVHTERKFFALLNMAALFAVVMVMFDFNPIAYADAHPFWSVGYVFAYLAIGAVWGWFGRWQVFLFKIKNSLIGVGADWVKDKETFASGYTFERYCTDKLRDDEVLRRDESWPVDVRQHIGRITNWMAYWPASMFWTLISDLITTLYTRFVILISGSMQRMASKQDDAIKAEALAAQQTKDWKPGAGGIQTSI